MRLAQRSVGLLQGAGRTHRVERDAAKSAAPLTLIVRHLAGIISMTRINPLKERTERAYDTD
jgi:hypothetical protein